MRKLTLLLGLTVLLYSTAANAQVSEEEVKALRDQIEMLTKRLDELERQNQQTQQVTTEAAETAVAKAEAVEERVATVQDQVAAMSWAERINWSGDFRYRYENIAQEGRDDRNRSRIRARTSLEAELSPTLDVGFGLASGGDDPVSSNVTIGGGGTSKDIKIDLAYFDWSGIENTRITGGKFKNFLARPAKKGLRWDGDWRPEGLGAVWDNGTFFAQGLGTWLEGDSRNGTEFAWVAQGGMNMKIGDSGKLKVGAGYSAFDIAGGTPVYGDPDDFFGNSFVVDPITGELAFLYDYRNIEAFAEYSFKLGGQSVALFGNYTVNTEADENDTGYLFGAKYGSAKNRGDWDITYFYEKLEADATVGLIADSDFGGGGTDAKGHVFSGTYAFHSNWNFKATYFINQINLASGNEDDYDRLQLDLNFKFD
ncbi:MAG: putative porin [Xanthomonadales bacterium]